MTFGSLALGLMMLPAFTMQVNDHPPVVTAAAPQASEFPKSLLRFIEDDCPVRNERENHDEAVAFDAIVSFARRVPEESFRTTSRRDLTSVHMLGKEASRYRGEVVEIQGRLLRNLDVGPTPALKAEGIQQLFEAYVQSESHPGNGWCVFHTSTTMKSGDNLNIPVTARGYFFKVYAYRETGRVFRLPLLIGRGIEPREVDPLPASTIDSAVWSLRLFVYLVGVGFVVVVSFFAWLRFSDSRARLRIRMARDELKDGAP